MKRFIFEKYICYITMDPLERPRGIFVLIIFRLMSGKHKELNTPMNRTKDFHPSGCP